MTRTLLLALLYIHSLQAWQNDRTIRPITVQHRVALVIGNAAYPGATLKNPANDARDIASALERLGFTVTLKQDLTYRDFDRTFNQFTRDIHPNDLALFYFSGHGVQVQNENYLLPVDFKAETESDVAFEAYPASRVRKRLEDAGATIRVLILDACRTNPYHFKRDTLGNGLAAMTQTAEGTLIAFAAGDNQAADDNRGGRNGLYTTHLLSQLEQPGLTLKEVFERTRANVWNASGKKQFPALYDMVIGSLVLKPGSESSNSQVSSRPPNADQLNHYESGRIHELIAKWARTIVNNDLDGQTDCYAPHVDRYFLRMNLSRDEVRAEKRKMMATYYTVRQNDVSDLAFEVLVPGYAVVTFRKEWDVGPKRFAGAERQRLTLKVIEGSWKIVGEEELKIYWYKKDP